MSAVAGARRGLGWRRTTARATAAMLVAGACGLAAGCGETSAGPSPSATAPAPAAAALLPLRPGLQLLTLSGFALSVDAAYPPCVPLGIPADGTSVTTVVSLSSDGGEWVARSSSGGGDIELRLRAAGTTSSAYAVSGTLRGTARDIGLMGVTRDVRVTLGSSASDGAAVLDGATTSLTSGMVVGKATGALRFSDSQGRTGACSAIQWSMQPY